MAIKASDDFAGIGSANLTAREFNNALGGTGEVIWVAGESVVLRGNSADGAVKAATSASQSRSWADLASLGTIKKWRTKIDPEAGTSQIIMLGLATTANITTTSAMSILLIQGHTQLRIREFVSGTPTDRGTNLTITAPGAVFYLELEVDGLSVVARVLNSDTTVRNTMSYTASSVPSGTIAAIGLYGGSEPGIFEDFSVDDGAASDTTAPTLTSVSGASTGPTAATISASTDEAGPGWAVYTGSATQPTKAQVKAGQDHTGSTTGVFADTATLAIGANPAAFSFAGMTPGATYYPHVVQDDEVTPTANTSDVESGSGVTMPVPPQKATVTLYQADGTTPAASITGLQWAWWDDATPDLSLAADISGTSASTDASGVFDVTLTGTALTLGQTGTLLIYKTDGTAESTATLAFCGPLATVN